jgi:hypothetical protein
MKRFVCIECKKPIRKNSKSAYIHRGCWIQLREKDERHFDFLFANDREKRPKTLAIKPIEDDDIDLAIQEIKDIINKEKPANYEIDKSVTYAVDIAGNIISI